MTRRPDTFIIGAPKSGTTSLHRYLAAHPDVFMSQPKEPGYFARDVTGTHRNPFLYDADESRYLQLFQNAGGAARTGEGSTNYLMSRDAPQLIHQFEPRARIIAMVRNPVDLVHSLHAQRVASGFEQIRNFTEAIALDDERRAGNHLPRALRGFGVAYRDNALLGEQLQRWLGIFSREQVHVIVFDDFSHDTTSAYLAVLSFLDLATPSGPQSLAVFNARHESRGLLRMVYRNRVARWISRSGMPRLLGSSGTDRLRRILGSRRLARREVAPDPIEREVRLELESEFAPDVHKLGQLLGRDLTNEWFGRKDSGQSE